MKSREKNGAPGYSRLLYKSHAFYRVRRFRKRHFSPGILYATLFKLQKKAPSVIKLSAAGVSCEGRPVYHISAGSGPARVLLWSQMHGDEPTATIAVCDILNYLSETYAESATKKILSALTLHFVPMLNPDGAVRIQRRNAQNIDINRDALALRTPEARLLRSIQAKLKPEFGFNLHDQELSTVGSTKTISAMSLLAPSFDHKRSDNAVRNRAKHLAAVFNQVLQEYIPGKVTKYDDSYEARAFGDNMQKWGTSTLLVESGHLKNDGEKEFIRKLNFTGILSSLYAIATGEYKFYHAEGYENLPINGKRAYDVIIRNVNVKQGGGKIIRTDLAVTYQVDTHSEPPPILVDMGDLSPYAGMKEINARNKSINSRLLRINEPFKWERYF